MNFNNKINLILQRKEVYKYLRLYFENIKTIDDEQVEHIKMMSKFGHELGDLIYDNETLKMIYQLSLNTIVYETDEYRLEVCKSPVYGKGLRVVKFRSVDDHD